MSKQVRNLGTAATLLPKMKRALSRYEADGIYTVMLVPDANRPSSGGDDTTGNARLYLYKSEPFSETEPEIKATITPSVAAVSGTQRFVGAMATNNPSAVLGSDNHVHIVYQGVDNSLHHVEVVYDADTDTFGAATDTEVVAGNSVTNRYRAIDIACAPGVGDGSPVIAVYEADASSGVGAHVRVYIRNSDGTTWRQAYSTQIMTSETIREDSEDVSIAWGPSGIVANVGRLALYYTNTRTTDDQGDTLIELSYNVSSGTDGSAAVEVSWATNLNQNIAAGTRRGWVYQSHFTGTVDDVWLFGSMVGLASPFFVGMKLRHDNASYTLNKTQNLPSSVLSRKYGVISATGTPKYALRSSASSKNRLIFGFVGVGVGSANASFRSVVFRWDDTDLEEDTAVAVDEISRVLDGGFNDTPLAIYGGQDYYDFQMTSHRFEFMFAYGDPGSQIDTSLLRRMTLGANDQYAPPDPVFPANSVVSKKNPDLQVRIAASTPYPNSKPKLLFKISDNPNMFGGTTYTFEEPETDYRDLQSATGVPEQRFITFSSPQALATGEWYWTAQIKTDLEPTAMDDESVVAPFSVSHAPTVLPTSPPQGSSVEYRGGNVWISWQFSDTEPSDTQSAYQVVVTRLDTSAVVVDTGKVASSDSTVALTIPASLNGVQLSYKITLWDGEDTAGTPSDPVRFAVYAAPTVRITSPADGGELSSSSPVVAWNFSAPGRTQSHYRALIQNTDTTPYTDVADSGWVASVNTSHIFNSEVLSLATNYRVVVYVRDSLGIVAHSESNLVPNPGFEVNTSGWSATNCALTRTSDRKTEGSWSGVITPAGGSNPVIESSSFEVLPGESYTAYFWAYSVAGWNNAQVTINWRDTNDNSISTFTTSVSIPAGQWTRVQRVETAPSGTAYARILITQTNTPSASDILYVDDVHFQHSPVAFTATWAPPTDGDISATWDRFKVTLSWTDGNLDSDFIAWRVYRKYNRYSSELLDVDDSANTWEMIYETSEIAASYEYRDYFAPLNKEVQYITVQVVDRNGSQVESVISSPVSITIPGDRYYFVPAVPIGSIASFEAHNVTSDGFSREIERETIHVIGRGRQVQVGDDLGYTGSFTIKLRNPDTARADREFVELLCAKGTGKVYIRSPFGDVLLVNFGNPQFNRMAGVGAGDLGDLTLPYVEIYDEVPIRRAA